jgi:hypothetical protein
MISMALIKGVSLTALIGACVGYWRHPESRCMNLFQHHNSAAQDNVASPDTEDEVKWRTEFDDAGEIEVRENLSHGGMIVPEPKRHFAFRWLREQVKAKKLREQQLYRYAQWTFWAAVSAVVIGIFSLMWPPH